MLTHLTFRSFQQNNVVWSYSGASLDGLITNYGAAIEVSDSVFVSTTIESEELQLAYFMCTTGGSLNAHNNCFLGNDERIAPIVNQNGAVQTSASFVHRQTTTLPSTKCEFVSRVTEGTLDRLGFESVVFACEDSDASVCNAAALYKVYTPCLNSLDDIYHGEESLLSAEMTRTYILCPRTLYKIGSMNDENGNPFDGSLPIIINHPNMRVLCGADGKSDNECVITGGVVQLGIFDEFYTGGPPATDASVHGVTFTGASSVNVLASFPGDVLFHDCIFRVSPLFAYSVVARNRCTNSCTSSSPRTM
jgi:hypothetical protein